jgi:DNA-binding transcriptional LysR family regulator
MNGQWNAQDLLIFARVVDLGSFSAAATQLALPRSTVSRRVAVLEEGLGERLLLRTTRRLALTEFGAELLAHARGLADEVDCARALGEHRRARPVGRLRVSMPAEVASLLLTEMLAAFTALHPGVSLELDLSPRRIDLLGEGYDLALRVGELPDDALLAARRLTAFSAGLYAAPAYLAEHGMPAQPEDLAAHAALLLLGRQREPVAWSLQRGAQRWSGAPAARIAANSPQLLQALARAGAGVAALPDVFARDALRAGELLRVLPDWCLPAAPAWAVFPGRRLMPAKTRAFVDMLDAALSGAG